MYHYSFFLASIGHTCDTVLWNANFLLHLNIFKQFPWPIPFKYIINKVWVCWEQWQFEGPLSILSLLSYSSHCFGYFFLVFCCCMKWLFTFIVFTDHWHLELKTRGMKSIIPWSHRLFMTCCCVWHVLSTICIQNAWSSCLPAVLLMSLAILVVHLWFNVTTTSQLFQIGSSHIMCIVFWPSGLHTLSHFPFFTMWNFIACCYFHHILICGSIQKIDA